MLLLVMGPLVGVCFSTAVRSYADVSGLGGTSAGTGEALWPLIGVWAPTFSACELAAVFLLPFVAIRLAGADRQTGALKLELQQAMSTGSLIAAKGAVASVAWLIAMLPAFSAIPLWMSYAGSIYWPEMIALISGHLLNAGLTIALGAAAGSLAEHPSTAAILTLAVTVGTWIVNFFGAIHGGLWERAAGYTPAAMVAQFQHGLIRADTVLTAGVLVLAGFAIAAVWMRLGVAAARRTIESAMILVVAAAAVVACTFVRASWDVSENRYNSLPQADERALARIRPRLRIEAHLAPEDPRRSELERRALSKLRRLMRNLEVQYVANTTTGLFEQTRAGYGEIWYFLDGRKTMSRATTEQGVLESIYSIAGIAPPGEDGNAAFRGRSLATTPRGAAVIFFLIWPTVTLVAGIVVRRSCMRTVTSLALWFAISVLAGSLTAADLKVDLSREQAGKPPAAFEPMVGTWVVTQDGQDKVIMIDGRPWVASKDNPTRLLLQSARKLYGTSNEELMDNARQFAYYPVAVLKGVNNFSNGTISMRFKTIAGDSDRCSGILFNVKPNGDWLAVRYNDTENNVAFWEFHNGIRRNLKFSDRAKPFLLDRASWHELRLMVDGANLKAWLDGTLGLEYALGGEPAAGRRGPPHADLFPANNPLLRPPVAGRIGLWSKTDSTSYFKDYVVNQR